MICKHCNGTGIGNPDDTNCLDCGGSGEVPEKVTSMTIERLEELKDYVGDMSINTSAEFNIQLDILSLIDSEISRQQTTSEDVQRAIHWFSDRSSVAVYMNGEVQPNFHKAHQDVLHTIDNILQQYAPPTSEATQKAIGWQQSLKQHHQREWEKTDVDWQLEPGAQEQHNEMMASFDMAIQALQKAGE